MSVYSCTHTYARMYRQTHKADLQKYRMLECLHQMDEGINKFINLYVLTLTETYRSVMDVMVVTEGKTDSFHKTGVRSNLQIHGKISTIIWQHFLTSLVKFFPSL